MFLYADSEDSVQTGRMPRLILVLAERTLILSVLSCRGSNVYPSTKFMIDSYILACRILVF